MTNNYYDVKAERRKQNLPVVIGESDCAKLIKATKKPLHKFCFKIAFFCGLRISEITGLTKKDFDKERRLIFVKEGKGKKDRYVPFPTKFITQTEINKHIPVRCSIRTLQRTFKQNVKKVLKRDDLHFHNLRHSFATNLLNKGVPITDVQFWLGHSRLTTTAIYLKVSPDMALKRYENLWT